MAESTLTLNRWTSTRGYTCWRFGGADGIRTLDRDRHLEGFPVKRLKSWAYYGPTMGLLDMVHKKWARR